MSRPTLVLLHSPFSDHAVWEPFASALRVRSFEVIVPAIDDDGEPPYATTYVARAAQQITAAAPTTPVVLVGHSGAGPLLPQLGAAQRAARRQIGGYVFLDASLPRAGASRLDLLAAAVSQEAADQVRADLAAGGLAPLVTDADLAADGLDKAERAVVLAGSRPRRLAFFSEPLPHPADWPDAPVGYLQTSPGRAETANVARLRGFTVAVTAGGHFAFLARPEDLATVLVELVATM